MPINILTLTTTVERSFDPTILNITMLNYPTYERSISPFFLVGLDAQNPDGNSRGLRVGISAISRPGSSWVEVAIVIGGIENPDTGKLYARLIDPYDYGYRRDAERDMWGGDNVMRMSWKAYGNAMQYLTEHQHDSWSGSARYGHSAISWVARVLSECAYTETEREVRS